MPATEITSFLIEAKLDGSNWTDITPDVIISAGIRFGYGIRGHGPLDRMAGSGQLSFSLNNSATNSGSLLGYYTPEHANVRTGFELNLPIRIRIKAGSLYGSGAQYGSTSYGANKVKFLGKVSSIKIIPGSNRERRTMVTAQDFMWEMTKHKMDLLTTQESVASGTLFASIIGNMTEVPEGTSYATGQETFTHGADDLKDEKSTALAAAQKVVMSEFGYGYVKGDGTLVFEDRHSRINTEPIFTLDGSDVALAPYERGFDLVFNVVKGVSFPRDVGSSPEVLFTGQRIIEIGAGKTETMTARYSDPGARSTRVGAKDIVTPLADTDFKFGSVGDGSSNDKNADLSITVTEGANSAELALENTSGSTGYVNLLQLRGTILRTYDPIEIELEDTTSTAAYGKRELTLNLPYQENHLVTTDLATQVLSQYKDPRFIIPSIGTKAKSGLRMEAAIALEPGNRITFSDDLGILDNDYFVQAVDFEYLGDGAIQAIWSVREASAEQSWLLGVSNFSELGDTTILGV